MPTYYVEWHAALTQIFQANVISLACHGVFERFPGLKVVIAEGGIAWLPDVMWRLDKNWEALRDEVPWVKRLAERVHPRPRPVHHAAASSSRASPSTCGRCSRSSRPSGRCCSAPTIRTGTSTTRCTALARVPESMRERIRGGNAIELYGDRLA